MCWVNGSFSAKWPKLLPTAWNFLGKSLRFPHKLRIAPYNLLHIFSGTFPATPATPSSLPTTVTRRVPPPSGENRWAIPTVRGGWRGAGERDGQDKLQPGEGCQSIGMLSSCLVAEARASARACLCHLPIINFQNKERRCHTFHVKSTTPCSCHAVNIIHNLLLSRNALGTQLFLMRSEYLVTRNISPEATPLLLSFL